MRARFPTSAAGIRLFLARNKPALGLALLALLIPLQVVRANPIPTASDLLFSAFRQNFIIAYLVAVAVEFVVVFCSIGSDIDYEFGTGRLFLGVAGINLLTLGVMWLVIFLCESFYLRHFYESVLIAELFVTLLEAVFYQWFFQVNFGKALGVSFLANLGSFIVGLALARVLTPSHDPIDDWANSGSW
jgi:hypothetical protein